MQSQDLLEQVRSVFVRMTRYPDEVVVAEADLEQDLGIDSVKRGEILAALRSELGLSEALKASPDELRTVSRIADVLGRTLSSADGPAPRNGSTRPGGPSDTPPASPIPAPAVASRPSAAPAVASRPSAAPAASSLVADVLAEATRHPVDLLVPHARLEEDLGIDHRRRDKIRDLLCQRGALPEALAASLDEARTVGDLARLLAAPTHPASPAQHASGATRAPDATRAPHASPEPGSALAGKTVLVTGSSRGLGRAIATALGRAGARVVINSFHSRDDGEAVADAIRSAGGDAVHVWGSVANPIHVEAMFDAIARDVGELHHFVSNASNGRFAPLDQTTPEHWELAFRTNVVGYHQCAVRAARLMERQGGGRIVALSSNGSTRYLEHFGAMGAVKAAVEALTRALAIELAPRNVQVNTVSAGPIYGHVTSHYPDHERLLPYWESRTPGGRLCTEDDVAAAVLLLLSDGARMINGATLTVDGGGSLSI
ncbi:SDR family oxidoreductase [Chondromyces apiculatus]|uniref:Enoyl-[acyl-carrier-protein] reductase n=1 Tax=Chondromyces apiculatus DSM 436 TaxID=1192034 RepID=A0A017TA40_9BACT|nr:SDR family oxidoreductase [Chondromyces apiculatus]EYF06074.1 Enoyl-[acyl-carrier-protein] reductase [Chondromyces apiculatus DSM 436]